MKATYYYDPRVEKHFDDTYSVDIYRYVMGRSTKYLTVFGRTALKALENGHRWVGNLTRTHGWVSIVNVIEERISKHS